MLTDFIMPVLVGGGMLFQVALSVDKFVHKQGYDGLKLADEIDELRGDVKNILKTFENGNTEWSKKLSELNKHLLEIDHEVTRLKAIDEALHRHRRGED